MPDRFFNPPEEEIVVPEMGAAEALFSIGNTVGQKMFNPELVDSNEVDENFDLAVYMHTLPEDMRATVVNANNESYANTLLARNNQYHQAEAVVDQMPWYGKYPGLIGVGIADPVNLIPVAGILGKTANAWKTYDKLSNVAKGVAIGGGIGAISNLAAERVMEAQGLPTDYPTAMFLGALIGGGAGGIFGAMTKPLTAEGTSKSLTAEDTYMDTLQSDPNVKQGKYDVGTSPLWKTGVPMAPGGGPLFPKFLKSDIQRMAEHTDPLVRDYGYSLGAPTNASRDAAGNPIAIKDTAWDRVVQWGGDKQKATLEVMDLHTKARNSGYKGNFDEFNDEVARSYRQASANQEYQVHQWLDKRGVTSKDPDYRDKLNQAYDEVQVDIKATNPELVGGVQAYNKYYTDMLDRGQKLGLEELSNISKNKMYMPRIYNFGRIRAMDKADLIPTVKEAIAAHPANTALASDPKALDKVAEDLAEKLKALGFKENYLDYSYIVPKELPINSHLKSIKVKLDDYKMGDLLINDAETLAGLYSYKQSRLMAIQYKFGTTNLDDIRTNVIEPIEKSLRDSGADPSIVQSMDRALKDVSGILRMAPDGKSFSHTFSRVTGAYDSMTMGGKFGANNIAEYPIAMWATGYRNLFDSQYGKATGAIKDILFKEAKAGNWEFANEMVSLGHMSEVLRTSNAQRMADIDAHFDVGRAEKFMFNQAETFFKYNGLRAGTSGLEMITASNAISDIPRLAKAVRAGSVSLAEQNRLARWGLDEADLFKLDKAIADNVIYKNGKLQELGMEKWAQDDVDILSMMTNRVVSESVIQTDTLHVPAWMIMPKPMTRLLTRFLRYPTAAHGIIMQRGVTDDKAGLGANIVGSIAMYGLFKYMEEQAQVAMGVKKSSQTKFDVIDKPEEAWPNLITKSMNYAGGMGVITVGMNYGLTLSGRSELGTEYRQNAFSILGPTAGRLDDSQTVLQAITTGEWTGTKDYSALKSFVPYQNVPLVGEILDITSEEMGVKR